MPPADSLRILVLSSDQLSRAGLAALLGDETGVLVTGQAKGDEDLPQLLKAYEPALLVWDVAWETAVAVENIAAIAEESPPVLALAATASQVEQARAAGALGLLSRSATGEAIVAALRALEQGLRVADPSVASAASAPATPSPGPDLTPRELEVLRLLA